MRGCISYAAVSLLLIWTTLCDRRVGQDVCLRRQSLFETLLCFKLKHVSI